MLQLQHHKLILIFLLCSAPCWGAAALVGCTNGTSNAVTTVVVTRTTTGGNLLTLVTAENTDATTTWTVADSGGTNVWTQAAAGYVADDGSNSRQDIRYVANALAITSVTSTFSSSPNSNSGILCEWSGMATATPLDTSVNIQGSGFITTLTSGSYTTTNANDVLIYSVKMTGTVSAPTPGGTGGTYTIPTNGTAGARHSVQYQIVAATQTTQTTAMSWTSTARATGAFAAFKAAAATHCNTCEMSGSE